MNEFFFHSTSLVYSKDIHPLHLIEEKEKSSVDEVFLGYFKFFFIRVYDTYISHILPTIYMYGQIPWDYATDP